MKDREGPWRGDWSPKRTAAHSRTGTILPLNEEREFSVSQLAMQTFVSLLCLYVRHHWMEDYKYLFKVVLVGNAGVGKTCLVRKFTQGIFPPGQSATIGVDFMIKTVKVGNDKIKKCTCHRVSLRRFMSAFVRLSSRVAGRNRKLCEPASFKNSCWYVAMQILIRLIFSVSAGNKVDKGDEREVPERIGRDFSDVNHFDYFLETSALDATNVDQLFEQVATRLTNDMKITDERVHQYRADATNSSSNQGGPIKLIDRAQTQLNSCCSRQ
ncbi:Protein CBR-RAB-30 [Caenorhabditis briggsae]|uniref:Protein CBR-RAB-30 n=1 Tax=Caenorhabditis briggsae TaxID=6238 RepID=A8XSI8_CAEBR|nr:Protein CBR-RAB-30 [Caenorhabditis briggsae]CAP35830.2 Protein CBR-RAB-30 [Caenorhabditis briggsae]